MYLELFLKHTREMLDTLAKALPSLLVALVLLAAFYLASRAAKKVVYGLLQRAARNTSAALILSRLAGAFVVFVGFMIAVGIVFPSVTTESLLGLLGVSGVAIGFAFKDIFQNFLAGILILVLRIFRINDQIEVDGVEGTVEDIQIKATILRTYDNRKVIIPNATIFSNKVTVNTAYDRRRISILLGIGFGDKISEAKQVILRAVSSVEGVLDDPAPLVLVTGYGASSVDLEIRVWITPPRRMDALEMRDAVLMKLKAALFEHGIDLPFPTHQILFHDQTEKSDGDRRLQREGWPAGKNWPTGP